MAIKGRHLPLGTAGGIATLNSNGQIPANQLDFTALDFKGMWNANTNIPALTDGTGDNGDLYIVSVGSTRNLGSGNITFVQGNLVVHDATKWAQVGSVIDLTDYYTKEQVAALYSTIGSISSVGLSGNFSDILSKPITLSGYGITDAYPLTGNPSAFLTNVPAQSFSSLTGKPTTKAGYGIIDVPTISSLSSVATSGNYNDLSSKPSIPAAQVQTDWNSVSGVTQLLNKPTIPVINTGTYSTTGIALQVIYTFPHGLGYTPSYVDVKMQTIGGAIPYIAIWDSTNITVTYVSSPGVVSLIMKWFSIK